MTTTADRLRRAVARMPAPLVSEGARARLLALAAAGCPDVDLAYLEHRVSSDVSDQVDVSLSAAGYAARAALASEVERLARERGEHWAPPSRSLARWRSRDTEEARVLGAACLEYDLAPGVEELGEPSLFFNAAGLSYSWDLARTRRGLGQVLLWLAGRRARALADALEVVLLALPPNFHLAHMGFMFSRADEWLRFCVAVPRPEVAAFLRRAGWRGTLAGSEQFLDLAERGGWVTLAFGAGPSGVTERLGIEAPALGHAGGRAGLLTALVRQGWCTPAKGGAVSALLAGGEVDLRCDLSHAKLVIGVGGALETKLYLTLAAAGATMGRLAPARQIQARARSATSAAPGFRAALG